MIISASRRSDIPALYMEWFLNRLDQGYFLVRNPVNPHMISKVTVSPEIIDCIVFWTKNPRDLLLHIDRLDRWSIPYYVLFTITAYDALFEKNLPSKKDCIAAFIELARRIGKQRVIWRYDPVFFTRCIDFDYHITRFTYIVKRIYQHTEKCITTFLTMYKKCRRNCKPYAIAEPCTEDKMKILTALQKIGNSYGIEISLCAPDIGHAPSGIQTGKCIDNDLVTRITGKRISMKKDTGQRENCCCAASVDIGAYDTCINHCVYCYANTTPSAAQKNYRRHDPLAPLLIGTVGDNDRIYSRAVQRTESRQERLKL